MPFTKSLSPLLFPTNNSLVKMYLSSNCLVKNRSLLVMFSILLFSPLGQNLPSDYFSHRIGISASLSMLSISHSAYFIITARRCFSKTELQSYKKNQVPQSQGKLKCHSLQGVLGGRLSIYFNTDHLFYGLVQKLSKSILNLFFIAFNIPLISFLFYYEIASATLGWGRLGEGTACQPLHHTPAWLLAWAHAPDALSLPAVWQTFPFVCALCAALITLLKAKLDLYGRGSQLEASE